MTSRSFLVFRPTARSYVHSQCLAGEAFGAQKCECGLQSDTTWQTIRESGGVVIYLRGHEGRGIDRVTPISSTLSSADPVLAPRRRRSSRRRDLTPICLHLLVPISNSRPLAGCRGTTLSDSTASSAISHPPSSRQRSMLNKPTTSSRSKSNSAGRHHTQSDSDA